MAMLATIHRDPRKHGPYKAADFHPLLAKSNEPALGMADLRKAFGQKPARRKPQKE